MSAELPVTAAAESPAEILPFVPKVGLLLKIQGIDGTGLSIRTSIGDIHL
jgi:hypothetical protein